jgi:Leucine-rich repeat (LRR) protein
MSSPDLVVARIRIAAELAAQTGHLDLSGLQLTELPSELRGLTSLRSLDCSGTQVSDLEPLRGLTNLHTLKCSFTKLEFFSCSDTQSLTLN